MEKTAIIFVGIQASGKTSFYKERLEPMGYRHVSMDVLRTRKREQDLLDAYIEAGEPLVIDNTNPTREDRQRYLPKLKAAGYTISCFFFQSRVKDCIERNEKRGQTVPRNAVAATSNKLELPSRNEGFDDIVFVRITPQGFETSAFIEEEKK